MNFQHMCCGRVFKIYWPMTEGDKLSSKMKGKSTANQHPSEKEMAIVHWL